MGRITVFMREDCPWCIKVLALLRKSQKEALDELAAADPSRSWSASDLEILERNVATDAAIAAQSIKLSGGKRTVPQVFFNDEYIGNFRQCKDCSTCHGLTGMMKSIAYSKTDFPPKPDAAMVKVTNDMAISSQPSLAQLAGLASFGMRSVINLSHPAQALRGSEDAAEHTTATADVAASEARVVASAGLSYAAVRPPTVADGGRAWTYTPAWAHKVLHHLSRVPKPALVHCQSGIAATAIVLTQAALHLQVEAQQVVRWAADLGHDLASEPELVKCVEAVLATAAVQRQEAAAKAAAEAESKAAAAAQAAEADAKEAEGEGKSDEVAGAGGAGNGDGRDDVEQQAAAEGNSGGSSASGSGDDDEDEEGGKSSDEEKAAEDQQPAGHAGEAAVASKLHETPASSDAHATAMNDGAGAGAGAGSVVHAGGA